MQVLIALVRATGAPVTRDELIAACWSGRFVSSDAVSRVISILRGLAQGIGEDNFAVETLTKVGYRLTERSRADLPVRAAPTRRAAIALAGTAGVAAIGALWFAGRRDEPAPASIPDPVAIIVMPFTADADDGGLVAIAHDAADSIRDDL